MKIGSWTVSALELSRFKLDGGAMFGTIPKTLWQVEHPADENNAITLAARCMLLQNDEHCVVVDTGMGDKWNAKEEAIYGLYESSLTLEKALAAKGIGVDQVSDLILTHLHFDHAGGATYLDDGVLRPRFPQARHWVQRDNWDNAHAPNLRERASYRAENFSILKDTVDLRFVEGPAEILPGIRVQPSHGHTLGLQVVSVQAPDGSAGIVYPADLIPTASHVHGAYTMGYDIHPGLLIEEKANLLKQVEAGNWAIFFEHDPRGAVGKICRNQAKGRLEFQDFIELGN